MNEEQKKEMVRQRLQQYERILFSLEMDKTALLAAGDNAGVVGVESRITAVRKAHSAVEGMI